MLIILLTGCSFMPREKQIEVVTKQVEKPKLNIEQVEPLDLKPVKWIVVTKDNAEEIFTNLENEGKSIALFALNTDTYEVLSLNMEELKRYILTQKEVLVKYKEYYEPKEDKDEE
tara:strand:- start:1363 stop:1707 length:345 start_codon:yes stop_codon:yes gene_type:complete